MARLRNIPTVDALVLPVASAQSLEAQTFPGFPGLWVPGVPVKLSSLGLTSDEALAMVAESGLPLAASSAVVAPDADPDDIELSEE